MSAESTCPCQNWTQVERAMCRNHTGDEAYSLRSALAAKEAEVQQLHEARHQWRSRMGLKVETDIVRENDQLHAALAAKEQENTELRAEINRHHDNCPCYWKLNETLELLEAKGRELEKLYADSRADELAAHTQITHLESALIQAREERDREGAWMLERITGTLRAYPNNGGDIGVMREVERIVREATATLQAAHDEKARLLEAALTLWRRLAYFHSDVWREPMVYAATQKLAAAGLLGEKETGEEKR